MHFISTCGWWYKTRCLSVTMSAEKQNMKLYEICFWIKTFWPAAQSLDFSRGQDSGWRSRRGRCWGSTSPAPSTRACACPRSETWPAFILSSGFVQNPVLSNVFHLSVIWIMKDIVEDFRLDITEHRLQPNHSKEIIFKSRSSIFFNNSIIHTSLYDNVYLIISSTTSQWSL